MPQRKVYTQPEYAHPGDVPLLQPWSHYIGQVGRAIRGAYPDATTEEFYATRQTYHDLWIAQFANLGRDAVVPANVVRSFARWVGTSEAIRALRHTQTDLSAAVNWAEVDRQEAQA